MKWTYAAKTERETPYNERSARASVAVLEELPPLLVKAYEGYCPSMRSWRTTQVQETSEGYRAAPVPGDPAAAHAYRKATGELRHADGLARDLAHQHGIIYPVIDEPHVLLSISKSIGIVRKVSALLSVLLADQGPRLRGDQIARETLARLERQLLDINIILLPGKLKKTVPQPTMIPRT